MLLLRFGSTFFTLVFKTQQLLVALAKNLYLPSRTGYPGGGGVAAAS